VEKRRREPPCRHPPPTSPPSSFDGRCPRPGTATRTWARHSSRFSPRSPVETTSKSRGCSEASSAPVSAPAVRRHPKTSWSFRTNFNDLYDGPRALLMLSAMGFAACVLLHLRPRHSPAQAPGPIPQPLPSPERELTPSRNAARCHGSPRGLGAGAGLPEEALERSGNCGSLVGRGRWRSESRFGDGAVGPCRSWRPSELDVPCLRFGPSTRLVWRVRSARISFGRVWCGSITSSI